MSYGYHADDGSTYATNSRSKNLYSKSRDYGEGETVGCGFDAKNGCVYFTKEGRRLGTIFQYVIFGGRFFLDEEFHSFSRKLSLYGQWS